MEKRILFILTGWTLGGAIGIFIYYNIFGIFPNIEISLAISLGSGLLGVGQLWIFYKTSLWLNNKIPWEKQFSSRMVLDFLINTFIAILCSGTVYFLVLKILSSTTEINIWQKYRESFLILWIMMVVLVLMYNIITLVFYAYNHYAEGQITDIKLERKQLKLQYEALKSQLSPHFLFNSLNTISSLIHQDPNRAEEFIRRMADTYQYVLETHKKQLISLAEEIEFVRAYYFLLCVRFKDGLNLNINVPDQLLSYKIPPLTIQILVENAIKHNLFTAKKPLNIYLGAIDNIGLKLVNNKTNKPPAIKSTYIGIKNIVNRYRFFTNKKIKINNSENNFEVQVPILKESQITAAL